MIFFNQYSKAFLLFFETMENNLLKFPVINPATYNYTESNHVYVCMSQYKGRDMCRSRPPYLCLHTADVQRCHVHLFTPFSLSFHHGIVQASHLRCQKGTGSFKDLVKMLPEDAKCHNPQWAALQWHGLKGRSARKKSLTKKNIQNTGFKQLHGHISHFSGLVVKRNYTGTIWL